MQSDDFEIVTKPIVHYGPDLDDMWYTPWEIEDLKARGVDVTGYQVAEMGPDRGLSVTKQEWDFIMPDGRVAYPWTIHEDWTEDDVATIQAALDELEEAVGCIDFIKVPKSQAANPPYLHGAMFIPGELTQGGSYTSKGKNPGWSGKQGNPPMIEYGASPTWMMISLQLWNHRTVQHEGSDIKNKFK